MNRERDRENTDSTAGRADEEHGGETLRLGTTSPDKMERIRQILFGKEIQAFNRATEQLDERITRELSAHRDEHKRNLDSLEEYFRGEIAALIEKIQNERKERVEAEEEAEQKLDEAVALFERRMSEAEERAVAADAELREALETLIYDERTQRTDEDAELQERLTALAAESEQRSAGIELHLKNESEARAAKDTELQERLAAMAVSSEQRFAAQEESTSKAIADLRAESEESLSAEKTARIEGIKRIDGQLAEMSAQTETSIEELKARSAADDEDLKNQIIARITTEQNARAESMTAIATDLREAVDDFEHKLEELSERSSAGERSLRDQILNLAKSLSDEIEAKSVALQAALDKNVSTLRNEKLDRFDMAGLLGEISVRITKELEDVDISEEG